MKVLFDTNLWISFMIGKRLSSLAAVLNRQDVEVYVSEQLLDVPTVTEQMMGKNGKDENIRKLAESLVRELDEYEEEGGEE